MATIATIKSALCSKGYNIETVNKNRYIITREDDNYWCLKCINLNAAYKMILTLHRAK